jgi:hypothetical protein
MSDADRPDHRWAERRHVAALLRLFMFLLPVATSVVFVAVATRFVPRPSSFARAAIWWIGLTVASTVPLVALFRVSLAFPDEAPSRFKIAMRTNTLRQLQRTLAETHSGVGDDSTQQCAERLVALAAALNAHDRLTRGHTERVRAYTLMIGEQMGLPRAELDRLHWAGLVHDIGKRAPDQPGRAHRGGRRCLRRHDVITFLQEGDVAGGCPGRARAMCRHPVRPPGRPRVLEPRSWTSSGGHGSDVVARQHPRVEQRAGRRCACGHRTFVARRVGDRRCDWHVGRRKPSAGRRRRRSAAVGRGARTGEWYRGSADRDRRDRGQRLGTNSLVDYVRPASHRRRRAVGPRAPVARG